jgi:hypothetical protein
MKHQRVAVLLHPGLESVRPGQAPVVADRLALLAQHPIPELTADDEPALDDRGEDQDALALAASFFAAGSSRRASPAPPMPSDRSLAPVAACARVEASAKAMTATAVADQETLSQTSFSGSRAPRLLVAGERSILQFAPMRKRSGG